MGAPSLAVGPAISRGPVAERGRFRVPGPHKLAHRSPNPALIEVLRHSAAEPHTLDRDVEVLRRYAVQARAPGQRRSRTRGFTAPRSQIAPGARSATWRAWVSRWPRGV